MASAEWSSGLSSTHAATSQAGRGQPSGRKTVHAPTRGPTCVLPGCSRSSRRTSHRIDALTLQGHYCPSNRWGSSSAVRLGSAQDHAGQSGEGGIYTHTLGQVHGPGSHPEETDRHLESQGNRDGCLNHVLPGQFKNQEGAPPHPAAAPQRARPCRPHSEQQPGCGRMAACHGFWGKSTGAAGGRAPVGTAGDSPPPPALPFCSFSLCGRVLQSCSPLPPAANSPMPQSHHVRQQWGSISPRLPHAYHIHPSPSRPKLLFLGERGAPLAMSCSRTLMDPSGPPFPFAPGHRWRELMEKPCSMHLCLPGGPPECSPISAAPLGSSAGPCYFPRHSFWRTPVPFRPLSLPEISPLVGGLSFPFSHREKTSPCLER